MRSAHGHLPSSVARAMMSDAVAALPRAELEAAYGELAAYNGDLRAREAAFVDSALRWTGHGQPGASAPSPGPKRYSPGVLVAQSHLLQAL